MSRDAKDWSEQLRQVTFRCAVAACRRTFQAVPDLVEPDPDTPHHPFRYFGNCPSCKSQSNPQASWERALLKAHQSATGPVTAEGKAATAANLAGHPTPDETLRTRFNAMKHGMHAETATYFPAKPDGYTFCKGCEVERSWCAKQPACVEQTKIFMLHHAAFEQRNPKVLGGIHASIMAALTASMQMCLQSILGEGVLIKQPRVELDRSGTPTVLTYIGDDGKRATVYDYQSNPAFKPLTDLVSRLGMSMTELGMTVRATDDDEPAGKGMLQLQDAQPETLQEFNRRTAQAVEAMAERLGRAHANREKDPVLIEHRAQADEE